MKKPCKMCSENLSIDEFYKHSKMKDGYLNTCKECVKTRVQLREHLLREESPAYVEKERKRGREKYHRLGYKSTANKSRTSENANKSRITYPEKYRSHTKSQCIKNPKGFEKHHWNYNEGFEKDIIFLTNIIHNKLHRYSTYDQERMMYRKLSGELIDTRKKCEDYIEKIKNLD